MAVARGRCPSCETGVVMLTKHEGKITIVVKCTCANHPDDVVVFDLEALMEGLGDESEQVVYIHKGNGTLN